VNNQVTPDPLEPDAESPDPFDRALEAAFGPASDPPFPVGASVLQVLYGPMQEVPRLHLRDAHEEAPAPVVRPCSPGGQQHAAGRYQLQGEIARGGMGVILQGRDLDLGRDIAVKVLLKAHAHRSEFAQRFVEEAQIAGQLQHPGVVPVHELGLLPDGRPYFTMKLLKGRTLADLLAARPRGEPGPDPGNGAGPVAATAPGPVGTGPPDLAQFLSVLGQVCQTLAYAHARGVIHRDLKPSNVMVGSFGEVQVMDWGLAKVLRAGGVADELKALQNHRRLNTCQGPQQEFAGTTAAAPGEAKNRNGSSPLPPSFVVPPSPSTQTLAGSVLGTPAYMAPEQARGEVERVDERADVFGLGAILCELLTGHPPFCGRGAEVQRKARAAELHEAYARLGRCGAAPELVALARRCLAAEPWDRPRHGGEVADALTQYDRSATERLHRAELDRAAALARAQAERKRRRATLALAGALVALVLLGGGGYGWWWHERTALIDHGEKALVTAADHGKKGRWLEARAVLAQADLRLADAGPPDLRDRIHQALADATMVVELEQISLDLSEDSFPNGAVASRKYREAFARYGIRLDLSPGEAAARVRQSAIRDTLVAFLHDWLLWAVEQERERIHGFLDATDPNPWRRPYRAALAVWDGRRLEALARLPGTSEQPPIVLCNLAHALRDSDRRGEGVKLLREARLLHPGNFWINYLLGQLLLDSDPTEAAGYARTAVALWPRSSLAYELLGLALAGQGDTDELTRCLRAATLHEVAPRVHLVMTDLAAKGYLAELPAIWQGVLANRPAVHKAWFGYAEVCLFLGEQAAYQRACQDLLDLFGDTADPIIAACTARACLLAPADGEQLRRAAALADRAAASAPERPPPVAQFAQALAAYRQDRPRRTIALLQPLAATDADPSARLVLAMAQFRCGLHGQARATLRATLQGFDGNRRRACRVDAWICHVLRREAETLMGRLLPGTFGFPLVLPS
jgi:serine/threonine-protein kinase